LIARCRLHPTVLAHPFVLLICVLAALTLSACASAAPTAEPDGPLLGGFDALPKALATVYLSPTPDVANISTTPAIPSATETFAPATFTPTLTPFVGVFMGVQTFPALDGTFQWQPTHGPLVVILTAKPGFHPTAAPIAGSFPIGNVPITTSGAPPNGTLIAGAPLTPGTGRVCGIAIAAQFANAYGRNATVAQRLGCPTAVGYALTLVTEPFQTGVMFWRDSKEIYALTTANLSKGAASDSFWRVADTWNDSLPASDPGLNAPSGLSQPVRGFGYAWRNNPQIRGSLGWALGGEQQYGGAWQDFEHGFMLTGISGTVYALAPTDGPPVSTGQHFGALAG